MKLKTYFIGDTSVMSSTNDFWSFLGSQQILIERSEVYFLVGMTLIANFNLALQ